MQQGVANAPPPSPRPVDLHASKRMRVHDVDKHWRATSAACGTGIGTSSNARGCNVHDTVQTVTCVPQR
eukprot:1797823-Amphidinium_carterae.1